MKQLPIQVLHLKLVLSDLLQAVRQFTALQFRMAPTLQLRKSMLQAVLMDTRSSTISRMMNAITKNL